MGWYEALKDAISVAQKADNIGLTRQLLDAQRELLDMQAENNGLRAQLAASEAAKQRVAGLIFQDNVYWRVTGDVRDGPFCPRCLDADQRLIRLTIRNGFHPMCSNCDKAFPPPGAGVTFA